MTMKTQATLVQLCLIYLQIHGLIGAKSDQVLLNDVKVLTLHSGQMTNARRSSPVPQLKCVGGTAGCEFRPSTVQCINRGSDGYDVQWECKTDMDNSYRFGELEVTCEGYNYPDDPYVLKGSCGLEYKIDLTEEGHRRKSSGGSSGYHSNQYDEGYHDRSQYSPYKQKSSSVLQDLVYLGIVAGIVYIIYKSCIQTPTPDRGDPPSYEDTFRTRGHHGNAPPPQYGFRQEYMPGSCSSGAGYADSQSYTAPGGNTGGGFWSGAFTGGVLGYLFGNRNNTYYNTGYQRPYGGWRNGWGTGWGNGWGTGWGNGWGTGWGNGLGSGWGNSHTSSRSYTRSSGPSFSSSSSGTRTASGFGGTKRR